MRPSDRDNDTDAMGEEQDDLQALLARIPEAAEALQRIADERRIMAGEMTLATELLQFLCGRVGGYDELWSALSELARVRSRSVPTGAARLLELSAAVRRRILEILRDTVDREIVPRWEVDSFRREAHRAALQTLRAELAPAAKLLQSYESVVQSHRAELEQVMSRLRPAGAM